MKAENLLTLGVLGAVAYGLYELLKKGGPASTATNAVAGAIAKPIVAISNWIEGSSDIVPTGNVILPNGTKIPLANVHVTWDDAVGVASFVYNGYGYIILPGANGGPAYDTNGDYHAQ
jgi:hypothetical protein